MAEENKSRGWHAERESLDRELDVALAKYAAVEPRAGLEDRVLARLQAERNRTPQPAWWSWNIASAAVALAIVVFVIMTVASRTDTQHAPLLASHPAAKAPSLEPTGPPVASGAGNRAHPSVHPRVPSPATWRAMHPAHSVAVAATVPKLDQFPSPRPLSAQEKLLVSYLEQYPERSALLARARTEARRQDQLEEMKALPSSGWATDSDDRE